MSASYATTFDTYKVEVRTGYRLTSEFDIGIEGCFEGNVDYDAGWIGGFATRRLHETAITARAGVNGDHDMKTSPYATIGVFLRY